MIYIWDNGYGYSDHDLHFIDVPDTILDQDVLTLLNGLKNPGSACVVGRTEKITWTAEAKQQEVKHESLTDWIWWNGYRSPEEIKEYVSSHWWKCSRIKNFWHPGQEGISLRVARKGEPSQLLDPDKICNCGYLAAVEVLKKLYCVVLVKEN